MSNHQTENDAIDVLAERLYEWSGGIFWRGETAWQDIHREEAQQWFAYAALLDRLTGVEAAYALAVGRPSDSRSSPEAVTS